VTVAVKKTTAKKSVAKKSAAKATKKSAPKKATSKATTVKKATAKKSAVKKTVKKAAIKTSVAKKAAVKKTAKKAVTRRDPVKKAVEAIVIPEAPIAAQRSARVEIVTTPAPLTVGSAPSLPVTPPPAAGLPSSAEKKPGASGRVVFAVVVGIILLGLIPLQSLQQLQWPLHQRLHPIPLLRHRLLRILLRRLLRTSHHRALLLITPQLVRPYSGRHQLR
jgi:hypothetical protein